MTRHLLLSLGCAWIALAACGEPPAEPTTTTPKAAPSPVRTTTLEAGEAFVIGRLPALAVAQSDGIVAVASPCEGRLTAVKVDEGDHVTEGSPLVDILCLDAGVLGAREAGQAQRIRALDKRARELRALRTDGLVDLQRVVEIERELLLARTELIETKALITRAGLGSAGAKGDATITLTAPQEGVVSHVGAATGALIDRVGTPLVTIDSLYTTRIEADAFMVPGELESFTFKTLDGQARPLRLVSARPASPTPDDLTSMRLRLSLALEEPTAKPLRVGARGHIEQRLADPRCRVLPGHAVQRRPQRDHSSEFCVYAASAPTLCVQVQIFPGARDEVLVCGDGLGAVGSKVLAYLPSWTTEALETDEPAPAERGGP